MPDVTYWFPDEYDHAIATQANHVACNAYIYARKDGEYLFSGAFVFRIENRNVVHVSSGVYANYKTLSPKWQSTREAVERIVTFLLHKAKSEESNHVV